MNDILETTCKVTISLLVILLVQCLVSRKTVYARKEIILRFRTQANILTVWMVFMLLWPIIWMRVVGMAVIEGFPLCFVGLLWPIILLTVDIMWISHQTIESEAVSKKSMFSFDSNAISGMSFALGGLLISNLGHDFAKSSSPILLSVVFLCIAFVLPAPSLQISTLSGITMQSIQKACLYCCVGLLVTALMINMSAGFKYNLNQKDVIKSVFETIKNGEHKK